MKTTGLCYTATRSTLSQNFAGSCLISLSLSLCVFPPPRLFHLYIKRTGLGGLLIGLLNRIASNMPPVEAVVLTCFTRNRRALAFYHRLGFTPDPTSPEPRNLRGGRVIQPDYVILSRAVDRPQV